MNEFSITTSHFYKKRNFLTVFVLFYGIGYTSAIKIMRELGLSDLCFIDKLICKNFNELFDFVLEIISLRVFFIRKNRVARIRLWQTYRGIRHFRNLPVRGQRSKTNAKTRKKYKII